MTWAMIYAGALTGSLAPDVDAPDASIFHLHGVPRLIRILLAAFGHLFRYFVYIPLSFLFRDGEQPRHRSGHRGVLHSPVGVSLASLLLALYTGILVSLFGQSGAVYSLLLIAGGFWGGCMLHLIEDSCTPMGIAWGYPISHRRVCGGVHTDGRSEYRPVLFASVLAVVLILISLLPSRFTILPPMFIALLAALIWAVFLIVARTGVRTS